MKEPEMKSHIHKTSSRAKYALFLFGTLGLLNTEAAITVNSLADVLSPEPGQTTLRSALSQAADGEAILFDQSLNGGIIELSIVGEDHSTLVGEVMVFTNGLSHLIGYFERDYGKSALYAHKNVEIDASALPNGITFAWDSSNTNKARVLAVYGNLNIKNVSITGGHSVSEGSPEPMGGYEQNSTRARGGGLAVWGVAHIENCRIFGNSCTAAVMDSARDTGLFGGGVYADIVQISDSIISGNSLSAIGVSGGGVFAVGGADSAEEVSLIERSSITGNRITGIYAYGGGVYSDGGGIGHLKTLTLKNCTIADNLVDMYTSAPFLFGIGYWRGGGVYMSNGKLSMQSCTIVENQVHGVPRSDELGKSNMAGGVAATIGNAHAAESITVGHCIIAGNTVHEFAGSTYPQDLFTGSLFEFNSQGYNRFGALNFSQMLVPVGVETWHSLCRKHYPKEGDQDGVNVTNALDLTYGIIRTPDILSVGVNASTPAVTHYLPKATAIDQVPASTYSVSKTLAENRLGALATNNFTEIILGRIENLYNLPDFAPSFTSDFETFLANVDTNSTLAGNQPYTDPDGIPILSLTNTLWYGPSQTWPSEPSNFPYIEFWHRLDSALEAENIPELGVELLGDAQWQSLFSTGDLVENTGIRIIVWQFTRNVYPETQDQTGIVRPVNGLGDIGAVEYQSQAAPVLKLDGTTDSGSHVVLRWNSAPDRTYAIWAASNLLSNHWNVIDSGITSTVPFTIRPATTMQSNRYFKVELEP